MYQYLSHIVQYVKAPYLKKSIPFVVSRFLSAMVSSERLNPGFRTQKKVFLSPE